MRIGVISDTHNNTKLIKKALEIFKNERVEMIIHAGDMDLARTLDEFKDVDIPIKMALGNIDQEPEFFVERAKELGLDFTLNAFLDFEIDSRPFDSAQGLRRFYVFHGNVRGELKDVIDVLVRSDKYDLVIYGHTHVARNEVVGDTLVLNPGSLKPLVVGVAASVAIYDTELNRARVVEI